jgi:GT2 family glycosyltransferase
VDPAPDLTVVVLSWNTRDLTVEAVRSVAAGAAPASAQAICVDNGSRDGSAAAVRAACPDALVVESPTNLGYARGNALALPHARGRHVCFLNSDALATPGALGHVVRYLDAHPEVGIAAPRITDPDGRPQRSSWGFPTWLSSLYEHTAFGWTGLGRAASRRARGERRPTETTGPVEAVTGACLVARRDLLERLGGFDPGYRFYVEDVDLCWRSRRAGAEVHVVADGPPVVHVGGASSGQTRGALRISMLEGILRFLRRTSPGRSARAFEPVFKGGVLARAAWEVVRAPPIAAARWLTGRPDKAARVLATASNRMRFLERHALRLLRA